MKVSVENQSRRASQSTNSFSWQHLTLVLALVLIGARCNKPPQTLSVIDDSGILLEKFEYRGDTIKHGFYESYYSDGSVYEASTYKDAKLHGRQIFYFPSGKIESSADLVDGQYHGKFQLFNEAGQLLQEAQYQNNKTVGELVNFYDNGQVKEKVNFVGGQEEGPFIEYYANGKLKAKGSYKDGDNEHGPLEIYDSIGVLIRKMNCDLGVCRTTWKLEEGLDD